jgi:hypothetical protein
MYKASNIGYIVFIKRQRPALTTRRKKMATRIYKLIGEVSCDRLTILVGIMNNTHFVDVLRNNKKIATTEIFAANTEKAAKVAVLDIFASSHDAIECAQKLTKTFGFAVRAA